MTRRSRFRRSRPLSCREVGRVLQNFLDNDVEQDFSELTFTINDSTFRYGSFINALIAFVSVAAATTPSRNRRTVASSVSVDRTRSSSIGPA